MMYRVVVEKTVKEYYLIEADDEQDAAFWALDPVTLPESTDEDDVKILEIEEIE